MELRRGILFSILGTRTQMFSHREYELSFAVKYFRTWEFMHLRRER